MIKILVVDDHAVVRAGVHHFISDIPNMEIGGEASSAEEAIRMVRNQEWDIVLLDIAMPDKSGVEVLSLMAGGEQLDDVAGEFAHLDLKGANSANAGNADA